ncbi:hypothetical protein ACFL0Y_00005 [Patescibacteria group bacterium]
MKNLKIVSIIFLSASFFLLFQKLALADVINPEWFEKKCEIGEIAITCSYKSKEPFGKRTEDECGYYKNDPSFRYLVGHGSSFGGEERYCIEKGEYNRLAQGRLLPKMRPQKSKYDPFNSRYLKSNPQGYLTSLLIPLSITLLVELLVGLIFMFIKKYPKKLLFWILMVNLITLPLLYFISPLVTEVKTLTIILIEVAVVIMEWLILYTVNKSYLPLRMSLLLSFLMNLGSFLAGAVFYSYFAYRLVSLYL